MSIKRGFYRSIAAIMFATFFVLIFLRCFSFPDKASTTLLIDQCQAGPTTQTPPDQIPNMVHQIWKDEDLSTYSLPASPEMWRTMFGNSNYTTKLWTDVAVRNLVETSYPWFLSTYANYEHDIQRADIARLLVVHKEGGIYADLDVYPVAPYSIEDIPCLQRLGYQAVFAPNAGNRGISNHFFMAENDSEFLLWALDEAKKRATSASTRFMPPYVTVFWSTGPMMVTSVMNDYVRTYNQSKGKTLAVVNDVFVRSIVHHAAGRYWHGLDGRLLNFLSDHGSKVLAPSLTLFVFVAVLIVIRWWRQMHHAIRPSRKRRP